MFKWKEKATNQIFLGEDNGGKGKYFRTRFLEAGLVKYSFGVCLLEKETIDKFVYNFVGCPVIIDHKDVTDENAKDERVGVISKVWFDQFDGWYWGEGVIFDNEAIELINKGYNVSCQYEITEYAENKNDSLHNGNDFDKVILNGKPEHLAIVQNPRYENAMIAVNALEKELNAMNEEKYVEYNGKKGFWRKTSSGKAIFIEKGKSFEESLQEAKKAWEQGDESKKEVDKDDRRVQERSDKTVIQKEMVSHLKGKYAKEDAEFDAKKMKDDIDQVRAAGYESVEDVAEFLGLDEDEVRETLSPVKKEEHKFDEEGFKKFVQKREKAERAKNSIIQAINELKEMNMFKDLFKKKETKMDKEEMKALFMECLSDLKASNEAEKEDMKKEEEAENKCKNEEEPDYKKLYEDLKAKMEAGNACKCKNEEGEEDKEEDKEAENKKAKNAIDEQLSKFCKEIEAGKSDYVSKAKAIELGNELF